MKSFRDMIKRHSRMRESVEDTEEIELLTDNDVYELFGELILSYEETYGYKAFLQFITDDKVISDLKKLGYIVNADTGSIYLRCSAEKWRHLSGHLDRDSRTGNYELGTLTIEYNNREVNAYPFDWNRFFTIDSSKLDELKESLNVFVKKHYDDFSSNSRYYDDSLVLFLMDQDSSYGIIDYYFDAIEFDEDLWKECYNDYRKLANYIKQKHTELSETRELCKSLKESNNGDYYILYTFTAAYYDFIPKRIGVLFRFDNYDRLTGICDGIFSAKQRIIFNDEQLKDFQKRHHVGDSDQLWYILKDDKFYNYQLQYIKTFDDLEDFKPYCEKYNVFRTVNENYKQKNYLSRHKK